MATFQRRKNGDGTVSFLAQVRIKPFHPTARAFSRKSDAQEWADRLERELRAQRQGGVRRDVTSMTVASLVAEYLADPETQALRSYRTSADRLAWWVNNYGSIRVLDLNVLVLREARGRLRHGRGPATCNRILSHLRSAWNWGRGSGLIPQDLLWPSRLMLTEPKGRTRFLSDSELAALLEAAKPDAMMHSALLVSLATGIRQGELLRLTWADIDLAKRRIRILRAKNNEARSGFLPDVAAKALAKLKRSRVVGNVVFADERGQPLTKTTLHWRWLKIRAAAGLSDFRWHDLRHTCASFLAQNGATLLEIGSVLGHKSPSVTKRYSHLVEGAPVTGHTELDSKLRGAKCRKPVDGCVNRRPAYLRSAVGAG
jgi:integrase